ncbi:MAG: xanthine dehydrogenase family protein subunit M [Candidatus Tectimicrobiota bacterium]
MRAFEFVEPASLHEVLQLLQCGAGQARVLAGGSDLLGELKDEVVHYDRLVSLAAVPGLRDLREESGGLRLGALLTLAQLEYAPRLQGPYRFLAEAARGVATPEIRQQGTLGGNLCQRPRCLHYRSGLVSCLKKGGTDCPAIAAPYQNYLSIMGGQGCFSVHASDLAPPLIALDAEISLRVLSGARTLPLLDFFVGPEQDMQRENVLTSSEIVTDVFLPTPPSSWRGTSLKARERTAGDFPLVSVAVGYALTGGLIQQSRIVLGGVAPTPWRSREAEVLLEGQPPSAELASQAAQVALADARPLPHNAFKVEIARTLIARAILAVAALPR